MELYYIIINIKQRYIMEKVVFFTNQPLDKTVISTRIEEIVETMQKVADIVVSVAFMFFLTISIVGIPLIVIYSQEFKDEFTWILNGRKESSPADVSATDSLESWESETSPTTDSLEGWESVETSNLKDESILLAQEQIMGRVAVKTQAMQVFCEALGKKKNSSKFAIELLSNIKYEPDEFLDAICASEKDMARLIFIPIILEAGLFNIEDHIVVFAVDRKSNAIEYYDPKGVKIENEQRIVKNLEISAHDFQKKISEKFNIMAIASNEEAHQDSFDAVNCGRFVCRFMKERENLKSLSEFNSIKPPDMQAIKKDLVEVINAARSLSEDKDC